MEEINEEIANGMDELKGKILDLVTEYEKKYNIRIHIGEFKYDRLNDKKDIILIVFNKLEKQKMQEIISKINGGI